jgi:hypothetical protein
MMSGIEVVGLVLGVWPVMLNLLDAWKATKGSLPQDSLTASVRAYSRVYRDAISKLLQDENISDKDRIGLLKGENEFSSIWKNDEFQARLRNRIDDEAFECLHNKSREIFNILQLLKDKIDKKELDVVSSSACLIMPWNLVLTMAAGRGKGKARPSASLQGYEAGSAKEGYQGKAGRTAAQCQRSPQVA